jgi:uncharacterized protein
VKIRFCEIPAKGLNINKKIELSDNDFQEVGLKVYQPVETAFFIEKLNDSVVIRGRYQVIFRALCSRCCEEFDYKLDKPFKFEYKIDSQKELDLELVIAEDILLSLPLKILCKEECKGLCEVCGQNLNIDNCRHQN